MITYDNISYRIAEAFQTRRMKPNSETSEDPPSGMHDPPYDGIISQELGDAPLTTVLNNRPVTFITWYEHLDGPAPGFILSDPRNVERAILSDLRVAGPFLENNSGLGYLSLTHGSFDPGADLHWESCAIRNFPGRAENWVLTATPLSRRNALFSEPVSASKASKSTSNYTLPTTRFKIYTSIFANYSGYQWDSNVGPFLALDRVLEDDELHSLTMNPWPYLRKYWSDVMFLVSPLTGEDFGPRQWHFEATYGDNSSSVASGYVPYLDYSTRAVRGIGHRPYYPSTPRDPVELDGTIAAVSGHNSPILGLALPLSGTISAESGSVSPELSVIQGNFIPGVKERYTTEGIETFQAEAGDVTFT